MSDTLHSLTKALEVLHLLRAQGPMRLCDIASAVGVGRSTAHRLLSTLREQRFVRQEVGGRRYELGTAMLFSSTVSALEHCVTVSREAMNDLQRSTGETVHLTVLRGGVCLCAASVQSGRPGTVPSRVGQLLPARRTAGGKVLLAALDPARRAELLRPDDPDPVGVDGGALEEELRRVRELGYARNLGESESRMYALAVPIRRPSGDVVSSLTVALPLDRVGSRPRGAVLSDREEALLHGLRDAVARIEPLLAY